MEQADFQKIYSLWRSRLSPFLNIGVIFAIFQDWGMVPEDIDDWNIIWRGVATRAVVGIRVINYPGNFLLRAATRVPEQK